MGKLMLVRQSLGIEAAAPGLVGPARQADANFPRTCPAMSDHFLRTRTPRAGCLDDSCRACTTVERQSQDLRQVTAMERLVEQQDVGIEPATKLVGAIGVARHEDDPDLRP